MQLTPESMGSMFPVRYGTHSYTCPGPRRQRQPQADPISAKLDVVFVLNTSSTACNLFAASGGTINGGGSDVGCAIPASKGVIAVCTAADTWTVFDFTAHAGAAA
jgi:hypothetical protein